MTSSLIRLLSCADEVRVGYIDHIPEEWIQIRMEGFRFHPAPTLYEILKGEEAYVDSVLWNPDDWWRDVEVLVTHELSQDGKLLKRRMAVFSPASLNPSDKSMITVYSRMKRMFGSQT